jgi:tetratricopeptide (TPR) repeat protein
MEYIRRARTGEELPAVDQDLPAVTPEQRVAADAQAQHEIGAGDSVGKGGDYQGALDHYRVAYGLRAASPHWRRKAASRMGHAYHYLDRFDQAIDMFQEVLGFPGATDEERVLMLDYIRQARKGPIESTEPSTSMTKEEMKAKYELGEAAFENGQYATALAIWKELYMLRDASPEIRRCMAFNMGICHQRLLQFAEAISLFEESLLFPNVSSESRRKALERIRQARKGELGPNLRPGEAAPGAAPGAPWVLFAGMVYFETGRSDVGSLGQVTITQLGRLLKQRHNAEPALTFLIELVGASSSRWRGAGGSEQAKQLNEQLAQQRAASVEAKLGTVLPAADLAAGIYQIDPDAEGDQLSENLGLDSDDNTWTLRNVALTVWASGASTQGGQ